MPTYTHPLGMPVASVVNLAAESVLFKVARHAAQIVDEAGLLGVAVLVIVDTQQEGRMDGHQQKQARRRLQDLAPRLIEVDQTAHQVIKGGGIESDDQIRTQDVEFAAEPPGASLHLAG